MKTMMNCWSHSTERGTRNLGVRTLRNTTMVASVHGLLFFFVVIGVQINGKKILWKHPLDLYDDKCGVSKG